MLKVHSSNRLESLFDDLSDLLSLPLANPLTPEVVLVQSQGMARWLSLQTAASQGIVANLDCSFPASFIWRLLRQQAPFAENNDPYERDALGWTLYGLLDELWNHTEFGPIKKYLSGSQRSLKLYQLSHKIAALFDQYMVFRPDWIASWSAGDGEGWQPLLWRAVQEKCGVENRAFLLQEFLENADDALFKTLRLPERLTLFGIPALPPSMFAVFEKIASQLDVHIFLLQPCMEYWADLVSKEELSRIDLRLVSSLVSSLGTSHDTADELYFDEGNPLLMNMGKMGRDFQHVLHSFDYEEFRNFWQPPKSTILTALQADILNGIGTKNNDFSVSQNDRSVQIHTVHSPMREVEVLYQNLLGIFRENSQLGPADVLVMVPDINLYAPFIEAVFSTPESQNQELPFSIADKGSVGQECVNLYHQLLSLLGSRMTSAKVFDFLSQEKIRSSFGMPQGEMETIRNWLEKSAVFWGIDGQHREDLGLPNEKHGTWQAGLDRLLLGFALPEEETLFGDILPCDQVEGTAAQLLAKFINFFNKLTEASQKAATRKEPGQWATFLRQLLADFIADTDILGKDLREKKIILNAIESFARQTETAQFDQPISFDIVCQVLQKEFETSSAHSDFLNGRITFCQMVPMRSIPFQVICLLGMNDGDFPRMDRPMGFDLMRDNFRPGDRCRRDDDRYLFLETILSARKLLYISYVGIGVHNSEIFPPSVVVSELLEALCSYLADHEDDGGKRFITTHPLQPFSPRYFLGDPYLNNFSALSREAAAKLDNNLPYVGIFSDIFSGTFPLKENSQGGKLAKSEEKIELSVAEFLAFFEHPVRFLLRYKMGLNLDDRYSELQERECLSLDSLARYHLLNTLLDAQICGGQHRQENELAALCFQEKGILPFGRMGGYELQQASQEVVNQLGVFGSQLAGIHPEPLPISVDIGRLKISGALKNVWPNGLFLMRPTTIKNMNYRDNVHFWLSHLLLNVTENSPAQTTCFIGKDGHLSYDPLANAHDELVQLAAMLVEGLTRPLRVFPRSTLSFAQNMWQGDESVDPCQNLEKAVWEAHIQWFEGGMFTGPERDDPYLWAAFGEQDPFAWGAKDEFGFEEGAELLFRRALTLQVRS